MHVLFSHAVLLFLVLFVCAVINCTAVYDVITVVAVVIVIYDFVYIYIFMCHLKTHHLLSMSTVSAKIWNSITLSVRSYSSLVSFKHNY